MWWRGNRCAQGSSENERVVLGPPSPTTIPIAAPDISVLATYTDLTGNAVPSPGDDLRVVLYFTNNGAGIARDLNLDLAVPGGPCCR